MPPPRKFKAYLKQSLKVILRPAADCFTWAVARALRRNDSLSPLTDEMRMETLLYEMEHSNIRRPKILSKEESLELILHSNQSLARFGDGEIHLMADCGGIPFQEYSPILAKRLRELISNPPENFINGINSYYYYPFLFPNRIVNNPNPLTKTFNCTSVPFYRHHLDKWLNLGKTYCDAGLSGFTLDQCNALRDFLRDKHIVLTGAKEAFQNYQFHLFDCAQNVDYCFIPNKHAFRQYDLVLEKLRSYPKNTLHILMAGPSANIWAEDLHKMGFRALDLGHIAKSYDYKMRNKAIDNAFWAPDE